MTTTTNNVPTNLATVIESFAQAVHQNSANHGWWDIDTEETNALKIALIHSEVSEALEAERDHQPPLWYRHKGSADYHDIYPEYQGELGKPEGAAAEMADAVIRILDLCARRGWPIGEALVRKHAYNVTRAHKHGGKAF